MFRKSEVARVEWSPEHVESCAARQELILLQAARLLRPGGRLVYSTCTFSPQENERVIDKFLQSHREFTLVESLRFPGIAPGRKDWIGTGEAGEDLSLAARLWPHRLHGEGHFIAVLEKGGSSGKAGRMEKEISRGRKNLRNPQPDSAVKSFLSFCQHTLLSGNPFEAGQQPPLAIHGSYLYAVPEDAPHLAGLKTIHPGWWLGEVKGAKVQKGRSGAKEMRFEPSHALAMGLTARDIRRRLNYAADAPETLAYLKGETLESPGEEGWLLVTVEGYPLGWGKRVQGRVKNNYPKGLRWY
jgi:NOL1/NOP2/fmu family ribosome biogenesis protein